jgi:hypothetical protein
MNSPFWFDQVIKTDAPGESKYPERDRYVFEGRCGVQPVLPCIVEAVRSRCATPGGEG